MNTDQTSATLFHSIDAFVVGYGLAPYLIGLVAVLTWAVLALYRKNRELTAKLQSGTSTSSQKGTTSASATDESTEYSYVDPNFDRSLKPERSMLGALTEPEGDAIYGNERRYTPDLYYGSLSMGAKLELADLRVYKDQYEIMIIKVKVLENEGGEEVGKVGWIALEGTTFRDQYDAKSGNIS